MVSVSTFFFVCKQLRKQHYKLVSFGIKSAKNLSSSDVNCLSYFFKFEMHRVWTAPDPIRAYAPDPIESNPLTMSPPAKPPYKPAEDPTITAGTVAGPVKNPVAAPIATAPVKPFNDPSPAPAAPPTYVTPPTIAPPRAPAGPIAPLIMIISSSVKFRMVNLQAIDM